MTRFFKVFLRDQLGGRVDVAGFGKHPAWDDHIDDIGLVTETLVMAKQFIYSQGIAAQLASGAWDQIERSRHAIEFDHRFVWGRDEHSILGAIWASADGKGRARFPMVICVQAAMNGAQTVALFLGPLEKLGMLWKESKTKDAVRESLDQTRSELNAGAVTSSTNEIFSEANDLLDDSVLPSLVTISAALKSRRTRSFGESPRRRGTHFRLPGISSRARENLGFWSGYLDRLTHASTPYLVIAPTGRRFVDVVIGEPGPNDFFCLRADETALPMSWTGAESGRTSDLEAQAKEYLRSFKFGPASSTRQRRSWWSGLFER